MEEAHVRTVRAEGSRSYELLVEIGHGGMGNVYLGRVLGMGGFERYVAIKCCNSMAAADPEFSAMFLDEARIAARIHHPNVVPTLDVGQSDVLFLVMEYVEGGSLTQLVRSARSTKTPMPLPIALRIIVDVLAGLHSAHELRDADGNPLNIVHRDVTPQNVIVGTDGVSRILDFGIATAASRATTTKEGHVKGKLGYLSPEQLSRLDAGYRSDIYSCGVVLWEIVAGARLFYGETEPVIIGRILRGLVPALKTLRPDVPDTLQAILHRAMAVEPDQRYATAAEFALAIENSGIPIATARTVAGYVAEHMSSTLEERRSKLRAAMSGAPAILKSTSVDAPPGDAVKSVTHGRVAWVRAIIALLLVVFVGMTWALLRPAAPPASPRTAATRRQTPEAHDAKVPTAPLDTVDAAVEPTNPTPSTNVDSKPVSTRAGRARKKAARAKGADNGEWWPGRL